MKYKTLGNTGLLVSVLCLGAMTFGDGHGIYQHIGNIGQSDADKLVKAALVAGVNFFDTADVYSFIRAAPAKPRSDNLSKNLGIDRKDVVLVTRSVAAWGRAGTMSAHRAAISWTRLRLACAACKPITSTSTRSTPTTA